MAKGCNYIGPDEPTGCDSDAKWEIVSDTPGLVGTSRSLACTPHVGALLTSRDIHFIYRLDSVVA